MIRGKLETNRTDPITAMWSLVEFNFQCCGVDGPIDYRNSQFRLDMVAPDILIPFTCCKLSNDNPFYPIPEAGMACQYEMDTLNILDKVNGNYHLYRNGCFNILKIWWEKQYIWIWSIYAFILFIQLLSLIMIFLVRHKINITKKEYDQESIPLRNTDALICNEEKPIKQSKETTTT
ncbi:hypothetical protein A3Q56_03872 [Intoshia linei]|uniref:Uncharacterized protein n=1 Tax=Intoshia linei TaxID=1819745 RepID=A0A177B4S9_9BILA|nr:hypothetical protein A3Q56_03872 [Intoshia linei]